MSEEVIQVNTLVAIDKDKNSQCAVKWAVENLLNRKTNPRCILIHVRSRNLHPQDLEAAHKDGRPPTEAELQQFFLPYRGFCARKGIEAKEVILHEIDVPNALADYILRNSISNVVVGASNCNALIRKFKQPDVPTSVLKSAPEFCAVYVISKGKVQIKRLANEQNAYEVHPPRSNAATPKYPSSPDRNLYSLRSTADSYPSRKIPLSDPALDLPFPEDISRKVNKMNQNNKFKSSTTYDSMVFLGESFPSISSSHSSSSGRTDISGPFSFRSAGTSSDASNFTTEETSSKNSISSVSATPSPLEAEMRKLRLELKQILEMYESTSNEIGVARHRASDKLRSQTGEMKKLEEARHAEEAARALAQVEKQKTKVARDAAQTAQRLVEIETHKRKKAEKKAVEEAEERNKKSDSSLTWCNIQYRRYTIDEIETATDYFEDSYKIGEGGYGPVYRGTLDHNTVAIKVLRPDLSQGQKQFQQEVEVLSCIRHPNMVLLLGACPEYGCLVYEYMENGSLEDRLFQIDNTPPIPWRTRFRIAAEIATALLFIHQTKPEPIVHRDLKPANILLDQNYVSKIADVGLARIVPEHLANATAQYHMTAAAGTFCYIDPEYQQTGMLSVKSDVYSLGVTLLQIITSKRAMGLSRLVEEGIENGTIEKVLDPAVMDWPVEEALSFAKLALRCCELRKRERPELETEVLPELIRLKNIGLADDGFPVSDKSSPH